MFLAHMRDCDLVSLKQVQESAFFKQTTGDSDVVGPWTTFFEALIEKSTLLGPESRPEKELRLLTSHHIGRTNRD